MAIAALVTWVVTALGGFYLLAGWLSRGGARQGSGSRLPVPVIFGHFALAAVGLVVWIVYLLTGNHALAWAALIILVPVAALGFTMLARWIQARRVRAAVPAGQQPSPAESNFPVPVVAGHGVLAVVTVVLVLLVAIAG
ncbi:hypothetical protein [Nonomuraea sp. NPDC049400]|uniref:hypothetical protein n=1 Tax=Nonomuraea sp. NPDC049400 TaxID=3364352 RepID=UPI0037A7EDA1